MARFQWDDRRTGYQVSDFDHQNAGRIGGRPQRFGRAGVRRREGMRREAEANIS